MKRYLVAMAAYSVFACACQDSASSFFSAAARDDSTEVARILEASPELKDAFLNDGWTALSVASKNGNKATVEFLLRQGADVNRLEGGGNSALFWATYYDHPGVVEVLLKNGALINNKCDDCQSAIEVANRKGCVEISKLGGLNLHVQHPARSR
jgi:ankyrin repeat protein